VGHGSGHPAISNSHNKTWKPRDHCARVRVMRRIKLVKAGFRAKLYFEFHHFRFHL